MFRILFVLLVLWTASADAQSLFDDHRYCGPPARDANGKILRSVTVKHVFRKRYACPATDSHKGACPGWALDHVIPLACGGCDSVTNLQWLPSTIKSCKGKECKDRWERRVYCLP